MRNWTHTGPSCTVARAHGGTGKLSGLPVASRHRRDTSHRPKEDPMSDPLPLAPPPDQTLAYQGQQEYRPTSSLQPKAALASLVLGLLAAAVVAGVMIGWYAAGMPGII